MQPPSTDAVVDFSHVYEIPNATRIPDESTGFTKYSEDSPLTTNDVPNPSTLKKFVPCCAKVGAGIGGLVAGGIVVDVMAGGFIAAIGKLTNEKELMVIGVTMLKYGFCAGIAMVIVLLCIGAGFGLYSCLTKSD